MVVAIILLLVLAGYAGWAYLAYNRVPAADRPCQGCETPALVGRYALYCRSVGSEPSLPPVVALHGGPGHSSQSFKNCLDFLAGQRRVIYYDQRGSGRSQVKPAPGEYTIETLVEELETVRTDVARAEKMVLFAHSFGGALALRYALRYPAQVDRIIIAGGIRVNNGIRSRTAWKLLGPALYSLGMGFPPGEAQAADDWFTRSAERDNHRRLFDQSKSGLLADLGPMSFASWRDVSLSLAGPDFRAELGRLNAPVLYLYGAADIPQTGRPVADELRKILPDCTAVEFARSGHWVYLEEPEKFQEVVTRFLHG